MVARQRREGGRQKAEGGRWKAEGGRRKAEGGRQKAEGGSGRQGIRLTIMARPCEGRHRTRRKTKKVDCVDAAGIVPRLLVQQKPTVSLQVDARRDLLYCEALNASLSYDKRMCATLP